MKLESRKVFAYISGMIIFLIIFILTFFIKSDIFVSIAPYLIGSILSLILVFMGVNEASKLIRSVFYRDELNDNKEE